MINVIILFHFFAWNSNAFLPISVSIRSNTIQGLPSPSKICNSNDPHSHDIPPVPAPLEETGNNNSFVDGNDMKINSPILSSLPNMEKAWRHAKKPLLRIGSKGVNQSHGNSLRQLLEDHTIVKVKINTNKYGSLQDTAALLAQSANDAGAPLGIECLQSRELEKTVLLGMPGTLARIESGDFPPIPPPPPLVRTEVN